MGSHGRQRIDLPNRLDLTDTDPLCPIGNKGTNSAVFLGKLEHMGIIAEPLGRDFGLLRSVNRPGNCAAVRTCGRSPTPAHRKTGTPRATDQAQRRGRAPRTTPRGGPSRGSPRCAAPRPRDPMGHTHAIPRSDHGAPCPPEHGPFPARPARRAVRQSDRNSRRRNARRSGRRAHRNASRPLTDAGECYAGARCEPGKRKCQPVYKPGSVWRGRTPRVTTIHLGRPSPDASCDPPGRLWPETRHHPYAVLLPAGFAVPATLPPPRWALTPPFHPYPRERGRSDFCGTFPGVTPAGRYPAPCFRGARTFLPGGLSTLPERPSDRLARAL